MGGQGKGEVARFDDLFSAHFPFVWRCLRGLGASPGDVDDLAQEVFLVAYRRMNEFRAEVGARPWLYGILRFVWMNHRRSEKRGRAREQRLSVEPSPESPTLPSESLEAKESAELVTRALGQLKEERREILFLVEFEEMPVVEVSSLLGLKLNTAYSRLRLAREDFRGAVLKEQR